MIQKVLPLLTLIIGAVLIFVLNFTSVESAHNKISTDYKENDKVELLVGEVSPDTGRGIKNFKTYLYSYSYYYPKFQFCQPADGIISYKSDSIAGIFENLSLNSPFEIKFLQNSTCNQLCTATYSKSDTNFVNKIIRANLKNDWIVDGLETGASIGYVDGDRVSHLYNHHDILIKYNQVSDAQYRIVGVSANPSSCRYDDPEDVKCPQTNAAGIGNKKDTSFTGIPPIILKPNEETDVIFTYSVKFIKSETTWEERPDKVLYVGKSSWITPISAICYCIGAILFVHYVLFASFQNNIQKSGDIELDGSEESGAELFGWHKITGDLFRLPENPVLLSILVGSGIQLLLPLLTICFLSLNGALSSLNRGGTISLFFKLYAVCSLVGTFVSTSVYKIFREKERNWRFTLTPVIVPGFLFGCFLIMNSFLLHAGSSKAVSFSDTKKITRLWILLSGPFSQIGWKLAYMFDFVRIPFKVNETERSIPPQSKFFENRYLSLITGNIPFTLFVLQASTLYKYLLYNQEYNVSSFSLLCLILTMLAIWFNSQLFLYIWLNMENHKWQWKSFLVGGEAMVVYVFLFLMVIQKANSTLADVTSVVVFLFYNIAISLIIGLICGSIGFISVLSLNLHLCWLSTGRSPFCLSLSNDDAVDTEFLDDLLF